MIKRFITNEVKQMFLMFDDEYQAKKVLKECRDANLKGYELYVTLKKYFDLYKRDEMLFNGVHNDAGIGFCELYFKSFLI